jgi:hypothetical protein
MSRTIRQSQPAPPPPAPPRPSRPIGVDDWKAFKKAEDAAHFARTGYHADRPRDFAIPPHGEILDAFRALLQARETLRKVARSVEVSCETSAFTNHMNSVAADMEEMILTAVLSTNGRLREGDSQRARFRKNVPCVVMVDGKLLVAGIAGHIGDFFDNHEYGDESKDAVMSLQVIDLANVLSFDPNPEGATR